MHGGSAWRAFVSRVGSSYVPVACVVLACDTAGRCNGQRASEVLQQLDLTKRTLGQDLLAEDVGHLLDGHALTCLVVGRGTVGTRSASRMRLAEGRVLPDDAVRALSQLFGDIVALVDDELLVEHLEHFPPCEV